jgi:hypothetical protein
MRVRSEYKSCVLVEMTTATVQTGNSLLYTQLLYDASIYRRNGKTFPQTDQAGNLAIGSIITNIGAFGSTDVSHSILFSLIVFELFRLPLAHADSYPMFASGRSHVELPRLS